MCTVVLERYVIKQIEKKFRQIPRSGTHKLLQRIMIAGINRFVNEIQGQSERDPTMAAAVVMAETKGQSDAELAEDQAAFLSDKLLDLLANLLR